MRAARLRAGQLFALSIGLLVVVAATGFASANTALDSLGRSRAEVVDRIDPALVSTQRFLIAMVDEETSVRGFALAGNEAFLEPYTAAAKRAPAELAQLQRLTHHQEETNAVAAAAAAWRQRYALPTIAAVRRGKTSFTAAEENQGKELFDALRARVGELASALSDERTAARAQLHSDASRVRLVVTVSAVAVLAGVLLAAFLLQRWMVAPLARLAGRVRGVVQGQFGRSIEAEGAREVAELGADVDAMRARIVAEVDALQLARDELERSNAELEQFAYVASHDLQEPLRKVASFTQMLQRRYAGQLDERADTYIEFAVDGAKRMQALINDLLAFSRVGRISETERVVDCNTLVDHALSGLEGLIESTGARIEVGRLPTVRGEPSLLELVFTNLISNGVKFRGPDRPQVDVRAERQDDFWCFTVRDNGIGIEPEYADRIFVIFQRLHPRSVYDGTGIGLAMCRKIVEHHGGTIWLDGDNQTTDGATFRFTLPAIKEDEAE
jgi:signal transduction histidine kinase